MILLYMIILIRSHQLLGFDFVLWDLSVFKIIDLKNYIGIQSNWHENNYEDKLAPQKRKHTQKLRPIKAFEVWRIIQGLDLKLLANI